MTLVRPGPHQCLDEISLRVLSRLRRSWRIAHSTLAEAAPALLVLQGWVQKREKWSCIGIRDCGGPIEGAEEGHGRSSIVSVNFASAGFHWFGRSQLIRADLSKGFSSAMAGKEAARGYRDKFLGLLAFGNVLATTSAVFAQES